MRGYDTMKIKSNRHWRNFVCRWDVPATVLADQFGWTNEDNREHGDYEDGFLCYKGRWYHLGDFVRVVDAGGVLSGWDGHHAYSYFSGVVIRVSDDGKQYQIGTYIR
jgi:hypothetical protein